MGGMARTLSTTTFSTSSASWAAATRSSSLETGHAPCATRSAVKIAATSSRSVCCRSVTHCGHCAFDPRNVADLVDLVTMHEYPAAGEGGRALALIRYFASHGRPLLLGETFAFDRPTQETFLLAARRWLDGSLSFYDGRAPEEVITTNPADAAYRQNLISYLGLRTSLQASPRWPSPAVATPRDDEPRGLPHRSR